LDENGRRKSANRMPFAAPLLFEVIFASGPAGKPDSLYLVQQCLCFLVSFSLLSFPPFPVSRLSKCHE